MAITVGTRLTGADTLASAMAIGVKPAKKPWTMRATRNCCTEVTSPIAVMMTTKPPSERISIILRPNRSASRPTSGPSKPETAGVKRWGENSEVNYRDYVDFLVKWSVITQKVPTADLITNELIGEINRMDAGKIATEAAAYRYAR